MSLNALRAFNNQHITNHEILHPFTFTDHSSNREYIVVPASRGAFANRIETSHYQKTNPPMKTLFTVIDALPGMIAWLIEILSLTAAGIAVYRTITNQPSMFYTALSALALLGVAIASDYYTNPNKTKNK